MVRTYKKTLCHVRNGKNHVPYKSYAEDALQNAIRAVQIQGLSLDKAAERFKVPRSTLALRAKKKSRFPTAGRPCVLTAEEEHVFVQHLNMVSTWGFPFDLVDLRLLVKAYLDKKGLNEPRLKNNLPGPDWASNFIKRHKNQISNRLSANISTKRAVNRQKLDAFFDNAREHLTSTDPSLIINFDETNLTDNPGAKKIIFKRGTKYPERVVNSTKTAISLMYAGTATGELLPVYVVYKAEHMWDTWTQGGPPGARYNRSKSGWFDLACFENWFYTIVVPFFRGKDGPKVLVGDNLSSYFSSDVLKTCQEMDISFLCLPTNSTHIMQPLDVAFYAPLKKYWRDILTQWKKRAGRKISTLSKDVFPQLLLELHNRLMKNEKGRQKLISGFRKTGLFPFDPSQPKRRLPPELADAVEAESTPSLVLNVVVDMLAEMRGSSELTVKNPRRRKVTVEPGKSVSASDVASTSYAHKSNIQASKNQPKKRRISTGEETGSDDSLSFQNDDMILPKKKVRQQNPVDLDDSLESFDTSDFPVVPLPDFSDTDDDLPLISLIDKQNSIVGESGSKISPTHTNEEISSAQELALDDWVVVQYERKKNRLPFCRKDCID